MISIILIESVHLLTQLKSCCFYHLTQIMQVAKKFKFHDYKARLIYIYSHKHNIIISQKTYVIGKLYAPTLQVSISTNVTNKSDQINL